VVGRTVTEVFNPVAVVGLGFVAGCFDDGTYFLWLRVREVKLSKRRSAGWDEHLRGGDLRERRGYGNRRKRFQRFFLERQEAARLIYPRSGYPPVCDRRSATLCAARFFFMFALAAAARLSAIRSGVPFPLGCGCATAMSVFRDLYFRDRHGFSFESATTSMCGATHHIETLIAMPTVGCLRLYM
jgi:hypothetical protein